MFKSDPESLWSSGRHLKQPLCKLPITVERKEEIIFLFSLFFFREKKHIVQIKSSEDQKLPKKKRLYSHWYYERAQRNHTMWHK